MKHTIENALKAVNTIILNDLNVNLYIVEENMLPLKDFATTREFRMLIPISTSQVGPLAPMFKSIEVEVALYVFEDMSFRLVYTYSYRHSAGGSNGYTVTKTYQRAMFGEYELKLYN